MKKKIAYPLSHQEPCMWFLAFTAFVGANLFQFGFTNVCPMGWMLRKLGVPDAAPCSTTA